MSNEEMKDCTRLPVVGVVSISRFKNNPAMENVEFQLAADIPQGQHDVCRLTDAQSLATDLRLELNAKRLKLCAALKERNDALARLAEKDARIAEQQGAAIELARLLNEACEEIRELKAQLQAAPAGRGVAPAALSRAFITSESVDGNYRVVIKSATLQETQQVHNWLARLNPAPAPAKQPWIPVSERLPDIAQEVIVHAQFDGVCAGVLDSYGEWFAPSSDYKLTRVNSWMPLPAAPATADSDVREVKP